MRRVAPGRVERLHPPAESLELGTDGRADLALATGLGELQRWSVVALSQGVDELFCPLPAQCHRLAVILPAVVRQRPVQLVRELLVAEALLELLQVALQELQADLRDRHTVRLPVGQNAQTARQAPGRTRIDRHVTHPSSFSNSPMSTTTGRKPLSASSRSVRGAPAAISRAPSPSRTTCAPASSGTARKRGRAEGSSSASA